MLHRPLRQNPNQARDAAAVENGRANQSKCPHRHAVIGAISSGTMAVIVCQGNDAGATVAGGPA